MLELIVCIGSACHVKGSYNVIQTFQQLIEEKSLHDKIDFKSGFCMRQCSKAGIGISLGGEHHLVSTEAAREFFNTHVLPKVQ
jgi:NADH:ubiquinone oxidoreductase subunit E